MIRADITRILRNRVGGKSSTLFITDTASGSDIYFLESCFGPNVLRMVKKEIDR